MKRSSKISTMKKPLEKMEGMNVLSVVKKTTTKRAVVHSLNTVSSQVVDSLNRC